MLFIGYETPNQVHPIDKHSQKGKPRLYDVILGRGSIAYRHPGNVFFRKIVERHMDAYSNATSKLEKTMVVSDIINAVRKQGGDFVRSRTNTFNMVSERLAREKVGQALRDALHLEYKSSTKAKKRKRDAKQKLQEEQIDIILHKNLQIREIMTNLVRQVDGGSAFFMDKDGEEKLAAFFLVANSKILQELKDSNSAQVLAAACATSNSSKSDEDLDYDECMQALSGFRSATCTASNSSSSDDDLDDDEFMQTPSGFHCATCMPTNSCTSEDALDLDDDEFMQALSIFYN
jgi:hypothetical protein